MEFNFLKTEDISTHSLTRRLTALTREIGRTEVISTHSLTRRLTIPAGAVEITQAFQLTASQGG